MTSEKLACIKYNSNFFLKLVHIKNILTHIRNTINLYDFIDWQKLFIVTLGVGIKKKQQVISLIETTLNQDNSAEFLVIMFNYFQLLQLVKLINFIKKCLSEFNLFKKIEASIQYYKPLCPNKYKDYFQRLYNFKKVPKLARQYFILLNFISKKIIELPKIKKQNIF